MKTCKNCNIEIRSNGKNNNVKYCSVDCMKVQTYTRRKASWDKHNAKKSSQQLPGKFKCPFCSGYYYKLASHTVQKHEINERMLKNELGIAHKTGLITPECKEILRDHVSKNYETVVKNNLLVRGKPTRFIHKMQQNVVDIKEKV